MAKSSQPKVVTKKHLARQQREQLQTRYILISSIAVIVIILTLVIAGLVHQYLYLPSLPVAEVNGDKIGISEFQTNVRYQRTRIIENYLSLSQYFGNDASFQQQMQTTLNDTTGIGQSVLDTMIEDILVRQEAERRGISVSESEVDTAIQEAFGYYPNGTPTPEPTEALLPTSTRSSLQETLVPATATSEPTEILPTATAGVITPTATATPYTQSAYQDLLKNRIDSYKGIGMKEADFRKIFENVLLREKVMEAVLAEQPIETEEEQVWARQILVSDLVTATLVMDELNNGTDFAELASTYSEDTSTSYKGGDMGWFGRGDKETAIEDAVWPMQVGEITSEPVETQSGYSIIQVLGHEMRPLDANTLDQLRQQAFQSWLNEQRSQAETAGTLIIYDRWQELTPTDPTYNF